MSDTVDEVLDNRQARGRRAGSMTSALAGGNAVPFAVALRFLLSGAVALAAFWTALLLRPSAAVGYAAAPDTLALVHVLTLGVGTLVLVGAMHQLVPVLLATHLHAQGWGLATFLALSMASLAVVLGFALGARPAWLAVGGTLAWLAVTLFVLNVGLTAARAGIAVARKAHTCCWQSLPTAL